MMNCRSADLLMQKSLDDALTSRERALLDSHLSACDSCRAAWEEYRVLNRAAKSWVNAPAPQEMASDAFVQRTLAAIAASAPSAPQQNWNWKRFGLGTAALLLTLIAAAPLWPMLHPVLAPATDLLPPAQTAASLPSVLLSSAHDGSSLLSRETWESFLSISAPRGTMLALLGALIINVALATQAARKRSVR